MSDNEKLLAIGNYIMREGLLLENMYQVTLARRTVKYRDCDQLDMLELIQLMDRWEYFKEWSVIIENTLYERFDRPHKHVPLTGFRYHDIIDPKPYLE